MKPRVIVVDYGLGNLRSVTKGLERAGASPRVSSLREEISSADGIVLPGVGAFREGMEMLGGLREAVCLAAREIPLLGICLGMQMLFTSSEEHGLHRGLGLIPGHIRRFAAAGGMKIPHMGWNTLVVEKKDPLLEGLKTGDYVYFVHSYYAPVIPGVTLAHTGYIDTFSSVVGNRGVYGVQFHPEKSGGVGLRLLRNFTSLL